MRPAQLKFSSAGGAHPVVLIACLAIVGLLALAAAVTWQGSGEAASPGENGKIAFTTNRDGLYEIYVMNADGSGQTRLSNNVAHDRCPAWSSDGTKIAFDSNRDPGNWEIYVMNSDGSGQTRLTTDALNDFCPVWSPDGTQIARRLNTHSGSPFPLSCNPSCIARLMVIRLAWPADGPDWALGLR